MIDASDIIGDPEFAQPLTINRSIGTFQLGGWAETTSQIHTTGVVDVASDRDLRQVPEGDRVEGAMAFFVTDEVYLSRQAPQPGTSDTITWRGDTYRLVRISTFQDYGYSKAVGVRERGA